MLKVNNMISERSNREVPNQFTIQDHENGRYYFQSYNSLIAVWDYQTQRLTLGRHFDYSVTTSKYLHKWIDAYCSYELEKAIKNAPGTSYSKKLQWCIDNGIIDYSNEMV